MVHGICYYHHLQHPYANDAYQFLGTHDTWDSSPQAFSAPQGAEGNTAKPENMMRMMMASEKMITVT